MSLYSHTEPVYFLKSYFSQLHILFVNLSAEHFNFEDNEQTTVFSQCHSYVIYSQKFKHDIIESKPYFLLFGSGKKIRQLTYEWKFQINYSTIRHKRSRALLSEDVATASWEAVWVLFAEHVTHTAARDDEQGSMTLPHTERNLCKRNLCMIVQHTKFNFWITSFWLVQVLTLYTIRDFLFI